MPSPIPQLLRAAQAPLLLEPGFGARLVQVLGRKVAGESFSGLALHAELEIPTPDERAAAFGETRRQADEARIAVIPVVGVVSHRASSLGASAEVIAAQVETALASPKVDGILFDVDSPGGEVSGVPELAARIFAARGQKPMLAVANTLAASAGYWIASAADEVWVTPSGETGSIGVWTAHEDWTTWLENEGVKITEFAAGKFKTEGAFWKPLSPEAESVLQARVDEVYGWFLKAVAAHRGDTPAAVRAGYGEGRVLGAQQSKAAKLVDRVGTLEEAIAALRTRVERSRVRGRPAAAARRELDMAG